MKLATQISSKPDKKAPVTRHPLFPAVVALWFGSLFGLGSLAVRATLIESLVLKLSLDVLLPMAAPPLGLKFRIILALLMAIIGIAVGTALAKRLSKPKQINAPRRRGVGNSRAAARQARAAAAAEAAQPADISARRRPLAVTDEEERRENYELAPLPGGAPAILDVTQMDIAMNQDESQGSYQVDHAISQADAPLDLSAFADAAPSVPEPQTEPARFESTRFEPVSFEPVEFEPVSTAPASREPETLQSAHAATVGRFAAPDFAPQAEIAQDRQVFRAPAPAPAIDSDEPADVQPQPAPLNFHPPAGAALPAEDEEPDFIADETADASAMAAAESSDDEYARMVADLRHVEDEKAAAANSALPVWSDTPPAAQQAAPVAETPVSSRVETAPLAELSPVELIERLALAMRQRTHLIALPGELVDAVSALARPATEAAPAAGEAGTVAARLSSEAPAPHAEPFAEAAAPAPLSIFDAPKHVAESLFAPVPEAVVEAAVAAPAEKLVELPAALRPIDLGDFAEHDDAFDLPLPPRSFAAPVEAAPAEPAESATAEVVAAEPEAEADVLEEGYSSLLDLTRPASSRNDFVRIEEPEAEVEEIEPVVLFPGHAARPGMRFAAPGPVAADQPAGDFAAPVTAIDESGVPQLRRFDAPAKIATPAPVGATGPVVNQLRQDPEEAQRALRAALATLQRMSGAA